VTQRFDPGELVVPTSPWGTTVVLSLGLHIVGFVLAVGLPRLVPRPAASPVYVVDLVSLPGGPSNASPPPAAPAAPSKPSPPAPPKEEKAVKIPDRTKKAEPKKTPVPKSTPPKPKPVATPAQSAKSEARAEATPEAQGTPSHGASMSGVSGGTGTAGGGFGGSGAAQADALTFYASLVQRNIENAWKKPIYPPSETSRRTFTTQIRIVLTGSGRVSSVEVLVPSGYDAMDRSVLEAVHDAMFPPFPSNLGYSTLPFTVEIVLTRD
jgi:periplasmic protein TonB